MFRDFIRHRFTLALALLLVLATSFGSGGVAVASGEGGLDRAIAAQEAHNPTLLGIDGVVGTGVGFEGGPAAVFVFTEAAGVRGIPSSVDGGRVIPQVTGLITALHHCRGKHA